MNRFKVTDLVQLGEGKVCQVLRVCKGASPVEKGSVAVLEQEPRYEVLILDGRELKTVEVPESLLQPCW